MKLSGKVAIVTGGGSGIGRASSILFSKEGAKAIVVGRNKEAGRETVERVVSSGGEATFAQADVSSPDQVRGVLKDTVDTHGKLDILFNNAGVIVASGTPLEEMTEDQWDRTLNINLKSVFLFTRYAIPHLKKTKGVIVNTSSTSGLVIIPKFLDYSVAKAGVIHLTKAAAIELAPMHVRVNCICPAGVDTPMLREIYKNHTEVPPGPLGRIASPEEIAKIALFLASDDSSFITGHALVADGGYTVE